MQGYSSIAESETPEVITESKQNVQVDIDAGNDVADSSCCILS